MSLSGATAAFSVGLVAFGASYRSGIILILFYLTGSKLTKYGKQIKTRLEADYAVSSQRGAIQVLANSLLASVLCILSIIMLRDATGNDDIRFNSSTFSLTNTIAIFSRGFTSNLPTDKELIGSILNCLYISHYACATADTWASEVGILSKEQPRLVTTLFLREVPHGTNGGMSILGTVASGLGGAFIGLVHICFRYDNEFYSLTDNLAVVVFAASCGIVGSLFDSILGATVQASYYSTEKKCIVKEFDTNDKSIVRVCGVNLLSNEAVNFVSILMTMVFSVTVGPYMMMRNE